MKRLWEYIGMVIFWLTWPIWYVYLKLNPERSRVIVIYGDSIMLVRGWLSSGEWMLPGGGMQRGEDIFDAAARELHEETGIYIEKTRLQELGMHQHNEYHLHYTAHYFYAELDTKAASKPRFPEISACKWFAFKEIRNLSLDEDAAFAITSLLNKR